jgi:hypothetical protein
MRIAREFVDEVGVVQREVGADADVVDADPIDRILEVVCHRLQRGGVGAEEDADPGDPDDAAGGRTCPCLVVGDVSRVISHRSHAGVAVNDWAG